jgi:hypothetical protein
VLFNLSWTRPVATFYLIFSRSFPFSFLSIPQTHLCKNCTFPPSPCALSTLHDPPRCLVLHILPSCLHLPSTPIALLLSAAPSTSITPFSLSSYRSAHRPPPPFPLLHPAFDPSYLVRTEPCDPRFSCLNFLSGAQPPPWYLCALDLVPVPRSCFLSIRCSLASFHVFFPSPSDPPPNATNEMRRKKFHNSTNNTYNPFIVPPRAPVCTHSPVFFRVFA